MTWLEEYYKQMIGFEIIGFKMDGEGIDAWPVYTVKKGDVTFEMVVSRDPEGNGPGFVFIENEEMQKEFSDFVIERLENGKGVIENN